MKKLFLFGYLFFLCSCSNVIFVKSQPENIDALIKIPEKYHGVYSFKDSSINSDSYLVTDFSVGDKVLGDSLIVKQRGNYLYLNFLADNGYEVYVVKINRFLSYENIEMLFPNITNKNKYLFNTINLINKEEFSRNSDEYIIDQVSVHQMNLLLKTSMSDEPVKLKRIR